MTLPLDHVIVGCPDLVAATDQFHAATGIRPVTGGRHGDLGTANALLGLGKGDSYVEFLGPDADTGVRSYLRDMVASLPGPRIIGWCCRTTSAESTRQAWVGHGIDCQATPMSRVAEDGSVLQWTLVVATHPLGSLVPLAIEWEGPGLPGQSALSGCELRSFTLSAEEPAAVRTLLRAMGASLSVRTGSRSRLSLSVESPRGPVRYRSDRSPSFPLHGR